MPHSDVWTYPTVPSSPERHPAEKPLEMLADVINASGRPGDLVLDCFAGRATTAAACVDTGRDFVGCEMDEHWHAAGLDRIEKHRAIRERRPVEGRRRGGTIEGPLFA